MKLAIAITLLFAALTSALGARMSLPRLHGDRRAWASFVIALVMAAWFLFGAWWVVARL